MTKMTARGALDQLYEAFERHLAVCQQCDNVMDERLLAAEDALYDAFGAYDEALYADTGMELPFDILDEDEIELIDNSDEDDVRGLDDDADDEYDYHDLSHDDDEEENPT